MPRVQSDEDFNKVSVADREMRLVNFLFVPPNYDSDLRFVVEEGLDLVEAMRAHYESQLAEVRERLCELERYAPTAERTMLIKQEIPPAMLAEIKGSV